MACALPGFLRRRPTTAGRRIRPGHQPAFFLVHPDALALLAQEGIASAKPGFLDRLIHAEYAELGAPLATFEKAARKLPGTRVLSPVM